LLATAQRLLGGKPISIATVANAGQNFHEDLIYERPGPIPLAAHRAADLLERFHDIRGLAFSKV
jgi:hypothetical protein